AAKENVEGIVQITKDEEIGQIPLDEGRHRTIRQVVIVAIASLWFMSLGILLAFSNGAEADIRRHGKTIYGTPITFSSKQLDMLSSMIYVGSIPGSLLWGWLPGKLGRKAAILLLVLPHSIGWLVTGLAVNPVMLLTGRFIHGIAQGATSVASITYIVEIGESSIRGKLLIFTQIFIAIGFFITVTLGLGLHYFQFAYLGVTFSIISFVLHLPLPESPLYLVVNGRQEEAKKILIKLRGSMTEIESEIFNLKHENEYLKNQSVLTNLLQPQVLKSLAVVITVFLIQNMSGLYVFYFNATRIIVDSTRNSPGAIDERLAVVLSFILQLAGTVIAISYIDKIGRKKSIIMSLLLVAICNFIMGSYDIVTKNTCISNCFNEMNSTTTEIVTAAIDQTTFTADNDNI
ncbi:unnamed protein product, partial [Meganyctiphanes norvegica]